MTINETILSTKEKNWILGKRITRLTDNKEVQIYPMGAERYISANLLKEHTSRYSLKKDIMEKNVIVIPGHGNSALLFAQNGAKRVTVYDKDPVTLAWIKAFKKYYHYREQSFNGETYPSIGDLLTNLTHWYPPLIKLPKSTWASRFFWLTHPNSLRRIYLDYLLSLTQKAILSKENCSYELNKEIYFYTGTIKEAMEKKDQFDTAFVPYLLGVSNGIEQEEDLISFIKHLLDLTPQGKILITPSQNTKEFYMLGSQYFTTTGYKSIQSIPALKPYVLEEDTQWFRTQGLVVLSPRLLT